MGFHPKIMNFQAFGNLEHPTVGIPPNHKTNVVFIFYCFCTVCNNNLLSLINQLKTITINFTLSQFCDMSKRFCWDQFVK